MTIIWLIAISIVAMMNIYLLINNPLGRWASNRNLFSKHWFWDPFSSINWIICSSIIIQSCITVVLGLLLGPALSIVFVSLFGLILGFIKYDINAIARPTHKIYNTIFITAGTLICVISNIVSILVFLTWVYCIIPIALWIISDSWVVKNQRRYDPYYSMLSSSSGFLKSSSMLREFLLILKVFLAFLGLIARFWIPIIVVISQIVLGLLIHSWIIPGIIIAIVLFLSVLRLRNNNFLLIVRNVVYSYEYLRTYYPDQLNSEDVLLIATGLVVTSIHRSLNELSETDVFNALICSMKEEVHLQETEYLVFSETDLQTEFTSKWQQDTPINFLLLFFTLNISAIILRADINELQKKSVEIVKTLVQPNTVNQIYGYIIATQRKFKKGVPGGIVERANLLMETFNSESIRLTVKKVIETINAS
jgi:hypothetical protein